MFKRILVAVDGSQTAELALQTAIGLATALQAQLRIVHAADIANINQDAEFPNQSRMAESIVKNGRESCPVRRRARCPPALLPKRPSSRSTR